MRKEVFKPPFIWTFDKLNNNCSLRVRPHEVDPPVEQRGDGGHQDHDQYVVHHVSTSCFTGLCHCLDLASLNSGLGLRSCS